MKKSILLIIFALFASFVSVYGVVFTDVPADNQILNVSVSYTFHFNATDSGDNATIEYSSNNDTFSFTNVSFTDEEGVLRQRGVVSLTPAASQVGNYTIVFLVMNDSDDIDTLIRHWNITANQAPSWTPLPNQTVVEDSGINGSLNLTQYVIDAETGNFSMNFSISSETTTEINCDINESTNQTLLFTPADNFTTEDVFDASCTLRATDPNDVSLTNDTTIYFNITSLNDPPLFNQTYEGHNLTYLFIFYLFLNASDPDTDYSDTFQYWSNSSTIPVDNTTGVINFSSTNVTSGEYVNISVNDSSGLLDSYVALFAIRNNSAPNFSSILDLTIDEDSEFFYNFSLNSSDPDNDTIYFFDNSSLFDINRTTGIINVTPTQSDLGLYTLNISVNDSYNALNSTEWNVNITNVNDGPLKVKDYPNQTITYETSQVGPNLTNTYFSDEEEDTLNYSINETASTNSSVSITFDGGIPTFTPAGRYSGTEYIVITADDGNGGFNETDLIYLTVEAAQGTTTSSGGGAGQGGGTKTREMSMTIEVETLSGFSLNEKKTSKVSITNTGTVALKEVVLAVESPPEIAVQLVQNYFPILNPGETIKTDLVILPKELGKGKFVVKVFAASAIPEALSESQLIINVLSDKEQNRIDFIRDLLKNNPECSELGESIGEAERALANNQREKANLIIQEIEQRCRDLISLKKEKPLIMEETNYRVISIIVGIVIVISLIVGYFIREFKFKKR